MADSKNSTKFATESLARTQVHMKVWEKGEKKRGGLLKESIWMQDINISIIKVNDHLNLLNETSRLWLN